MGPGPTVFTGHCSFGVSANTRRANPHPPRARAGEQTDRAWSRCPRALNLDRMSSQTLTFSLPYPHLALVDSANRSEPALSDADRAELGSALLELLVDLHSAGSLRPRSVETPSGQALEIPLAVPGASDIVARVSRSTACFELTISGALWSDLLVLVESGGRLEALYNEYFRSQADQEKAAKDALVQGFNLLRLVKTWGVNQSD